MIELPVARKFGGPEIALLALAFAFAIAMTAWWHGLYQSPANPRAFAQDYTQRAEAVPTENVRQVTVVAYLVNNNAGDTLPDLENVTSAVVALPPKEYDPNQSLLQFVAVAGGIAVAVYCLAVYPFLRRHT